VSPEPNDPTGWHRSSGLPPKVWIQTIEPFPRLPYPVPPRRRVPDPPTPVPPPVVDVAEIHTEPQPAPVQVAPAEEWPTTTVTDIDGVLGWRNRWWLRLVLRITTHRRR
jgi:hypothetical protein